MATNTPILGLTKPAYTDDADVAVINSNSDLLDAEAGRTRANFAAEYSTSSAYAVGAFCTHAGILYQCNTAIGSGGEAWTAAHWTQISAGDAIVANNQAIARMESTQFEESVTINAYTSSSNPYTFPNDGYLMISAGSGTNSLYDVYVIASDSATAVLARLNKRFTEASQVDSLFVRKGTRAYVADRSSSVTVAFREFK